MNIYSVSLIQQMSHKYNKCINATDVVQMQQLVVKIQQRYFVSLIPHNVVKTQQMLRKYNKLSVRLKDSPKSRDYI